MSGPGRPQNLNWTTWALNGTPTYLGTIISVSGEAVNNATTAKPFRATALGPTNQPLPNLTHTLAGKMLLIQPSVDGLILFSASASMVSGQNTIIAQQSVQPPLLGTAPGVGIGAGERVVTLVQSTIGWLQWLPGSGAGNLLVWELT